MEHQTNEQPVNTGKILSAVFAIFSCIVVFFLNISVFSFRQFWGEYYVLFLVSDILQLFAVIVSFVFIVVCIVSFASKEDKRSIFMLVCILEVALSVLMFLYDIIRRIIFVLHAPDVMYVIDFIFPYLPFLQVIFCVGLLIGYIICNKKFPIASAPNGAAQTGGQYATAGNVQAGQEDGYYPLMAHALLMIFVGWVWRYVWIYRVNKYLNSRTDFNRSPVASLLLCMFIPFYSIYWMYKAAQEIDKLKAPYKWEEISILCLIVEIFVSKVTPIIMQKEINDIISAENGATAAHENYSAANSVTVDQSAENTADEHKNNEQLLDEGAITQEEYGAVKSE